MQTVSDSSAHGTLSARLAAETLASLQAVGVKELVLCAGARNAPLVLAAERQPAFTVFRFFEERSAAFFALGRCREGGAPVAVITTSGTAVAECLPAVIEAYYQGRPLLVLSADRPRGFRGTGAPQSIEQVGMFGQYAPTLVDIDAGEPWPALQPVRRPTHWNLGFPEPLNRPALQPERHAPLLTKVEIRKPDLEPWMNFARECKRPLGLVGPLERRERNAVLAFFRACGIPYFAEALSGIAGALEADAKAGEASAREWLLQCDGVLRFGGVPTSRLWRDVELRRVPILSLSEQPWSGTPTGALVSAPLTELLSHLTPPVQWGWKPFQLYRDRKLSDALQGLFLRFPKAEPSLVRSWGMSLDRNASVYVGNSLAVREWELFARDDESAIPWASRGANGIDGQISTFLGGAKAGEMNYALLGDLTVLYDPSGFWALRERPVPFQLAVLNNGGGRIFGRIFSDSQFENRHELRFEGLAQLWGLSFRRQTEGPFHPEYQGILEIVPDEDETQKFWSEWERACLT